MNKKPCYLWTNESKIKLVNYGNPQVKPLGLQSIENASNLCQFLLDVTPGSSLDQITDFIAQRMIDIFNNPYTLESHKTDKQHISNHVRVAMIDLANKFNQD